MDNSKILPNQKPKGVQICMKVWSLNEEIMDSQTKATTSLKMYLKSLEIFQNVPQIMKITSIYLDIILKSLILHLKSLNSIQNVFKILQKVSYYLLNPLYLWKCLQKTS
jgi:hypothetical protein